MAVCCQNLPLGALSSRSVLPVPVGALFKKLGLYLNTSCIYIIPGIVISVEVESLYIVHPVLCVIVGGGLVRGEWDSDAARVMWWGCVYYAWCGFKRVSKIMLVKMVESSFRWLSFVCSA